MSVALSTVALIGLGACAFEGTGTTNDTQESAPAAQFAPGEPLVAVGESLFLASAFDSAEATWSLALDAARAAGDARTEGRVHTQLAHSTRMRGDAAGARAHLVTAMTLQRLHADSAGLGESWNALGLVALDEDRLEEARDAFERARMPGGDKRLIAKATGNLGLALAYLGELGEARRLVSEMADSSRALGEPRFEANALANLSMLDIWEGRAAAALPTLARARAIYGAIDYAPGEQNALGQLAVAYEGLGDYGSAFAALDSSLAIARDKGMHSAEAEIVRLIAGLHERSGDLPGALRQFALAAGAAERAGATGERASIDRSTAAVHLALGNRARAREDVERALGAHRRIDAKFDVVDDLLLLARVRRHSGESDAARDAIREARAGAVAVGAPSLRRAVALEEARLADAAGDAAGVLGAVDELRSKDDASTDVAQRAEAEALAARAWLRRQRLDSAATAGSRALSALARLRDGLESEPMRRAFLMDRSEIYADHVATLLRLGRTREAFLVADGARSRGLVEKLAAWRPAGAGTAGASDGEEGEQLLREIDALLKLLRSHTEAPPVERSPASNEVGAHLERRLEESRARYEAYSARTAREQRRGALLLGTVGSSTERIMAALAPDERLVEYLVSGARVVLFVVSRDSVHALRLNADARVLVEQVRVLRETWGRRDEGWRVALPASRALYRALVAPARDAGLLDGARRLIVVPHGVLAQLPFAALRVTGNDADVGADRVGGSAGTDRKERWLVEEMELLYLPSAAALPALRADPAPARALPTAAFAPFPKELPASGAEVTAVGRESRTSTGAVAPNLTTVAFGKRATEASIRRALGAEAIVHIATHGVLNARNPLFTRIDLAPGARPLQGSDDGRLEVHELLTLRVRSPLVFLSGCETSAFQGWLDDPVRGTDHATLAQAFLRAGARNVVGTLWRIDDNGAAAFASAFHQRLREAGSVSALSLAQRRLLGDPRFADPYFWASYVLHGTGDATGAIAVAERITAEIPRRASVQ